MATSSTGSFEFSLQKLTDLVSEEIVAIPSPTRSRGVDLGPSVEAFINWLQRVYRHRNAEQQEFLITVRTPEQAENQTAFERFCDSLQFDGKCVPKEAITGIAGTNGIGGDGQGLSATDDTQAMQIEIDIDIADTNGVTSPYTVFFKLDPIAFFEGGLTDIRHQIPKNPPGAKEIKLEISSQAGTFFATMSPPQGAKRQVTQQSSVEFPHFAGVPTFYQLHLTLQLGNQYTIEGEYEV